MSHIPVLLDEVLSCLHPTPGDFVIDGTVGSGGHANAILERIGENGKLLGIDWDREHINTLREEMGDRHNVVLVNGNYADIPEILQAHRLGKANCLLLDLGFSSLHIEGSGKGFSFMNDEPLNMTYSDESRPVYEFLKTMREEEIADTLRIYGEERFAKRIAHAIYSRERRNPLMTTRELVEVIESVVPRRVHKGKGIHPATRTFQAFRIYANRELENLRIVLERIPHILAPGGRVGIVSFHSLEDRIVKQAFRAFASAGIFEDITKKPIVPSEDEIQRNPRSRSAKLRAGRLRELQS